MSNDSIEDPNFPDERQRKMAELVAVRGKVRISQLTGIFRVSEPTIRKDLTILEQQGLLKRTHGGAVSIRPPAEQAIITRISQHAEAKKLIARLCLDQLSDGEAIFLDSGTTVQQIAHALASSGRQLTVLTDSPLIAETVANIPGVSHLLIGGQLRPISGCLIGPLATENLKQFTISTAFIGASGITEAGITVADLSEAQLKAAVVLKAQRVIVPVDHSKIGASDFARVCDLKDIDVVVTDIVDERLERFCRLSNVQVLAARNRSDG